MHPALRDVEAKLAGAQNRLQALEDPIGQGAVTDLVELWADRDRQGRVRVRIKKVSEMPQEWHVWIGECVHDIRSGLDHLAYRLNVAGSRSNPPPNFAKSQFPIHSRRESVRGRRGRPGIQGFRNMARDRHSRPDKCPAGFFPRGAWTVLEREQPYHRGRDLDTVWLEVLAELSNIDKHRRFPVVAMTPLAIFPPSEVLGHPVVAAKFPPIRALEQNATIMWLEVPSLPASAQEPKVDFDYGFSASFTRKVSDAPIPVILPFEPIDFVLRSILRHVRGRVVPAFEPFLG